MVQLFWFCLFLLLIQKRTKPLLFQTSVRWVKIAAVFEHTQAIR